MARMDTTIDLIEPRTPRLQLRQWRDDDLPAFAELNADEQVMEYLIGPLSQTQSDAMAQQIRELIAQRGWGFWAVERLADSRFLGFVGLHTPRPELPCSPCVEIGWRLVRDAWGQGFATEAAQAALRAGFDRLQLKEIVAFTAAGNLRSQAVMRRLGMEHVPARDFAHPSLPAGHRLRPHRLFRLTAGQYRGATD